MGEIIWVEILSRQRNVEARHRCMGPLIHIGRAYDNDVVLDDPYVAADAHERTRAAKAGDHVAVSGQDFHPDHLVDRTASRKRLPSATASS